MRDSQRSSFRRKAAAVFAALVAAKLMALALFGFAGDTVLTTSAHAQQAPSPDEIPAKKDEPARNIEPGGLDLEIIEDVEKRTKELDSREEELRSREERLRAMSEDIERQIAELKAVQKKIEEQIALRGDLEKKAVDKLAKTYAAMPPESAAELIGQMDEAIAIRVLFAMKERAAGRILAAAPPELASKLSEGLVKKQVE